MIIKNRASRELILNSFINFLQKKGKYFVAKNLIIKLDEHIHNKLNINLKFINVLEEIIKKLILPIIMSHKNLKKQKYYFNIISFFKYIKKFIFIPLLKSARRSKKYPFIYNFLTEISTMLADTHNLIEKKHNLVDIFTNTNSYIRVKKSKNTVTLNSTKSCLYLYKKFNYMNKFKNNIYIKYSHIKDINILKIKNNK